jgi:hypothetical protein
MRNFPTSLRFESRDMQEQLWAAVEGLGLGVSQDSDGTVRFKAEAWGAVNTEAHKLRDKRFGEWYFMMNATPPTMLTQFVQRLRAHSLPYEVEFHDSPVVLLLPRRDERRHQEIMLE